MIEHEDLLRDQRLGWFLTLNGFLFAALSLAWERPVALIFVLGAVGLVIAVSAFATLRASELAIRKLRYSVALHGTPVVGMQSTDFPPKKAKERPGIPTDDRLPVAGAPDSNNGSEDKDMKFTWFDGWVPDLYLWKVAPCVLAVAWTILPIVRACD